MKQFPTFLEYLNKTLIFSRTFFDTVKEYIEINNFEKVYFS